MSSLLLFVSQAANLYGSERTLLTLLEQPLPEPYKPLVVCPAAGPLCQALDALKIERIPWEFNRASLRNNPNWHVRFFLSFRSLLKERRPRAVILVYEGNVPLLAAACLATRTPYLRILQREVRPAASNTPLLARLADCLAFRFARGVFCGAQTLETQLRAACGSRAPLRTALVRLPVRSPNNSFRNRAAWRRTFSIPPNVPLVGQFSRIHPVKGLDVLLRAAARVLREAPTTHFIIGGGPDTTTGSAGYLEQLRSLSVELGIEQQVAFTGHLIDPFTAMRACDMVVQASRAEGVGLAPLEAVLAGRPVIASAVDGLEEVIQLSGGGLLFPSGDDTALAQNILLLLSNPKRRASLAAQGAQWIQQNCAHAIFRQNFWATFDRFLNGNTSKTVSNDSRVLPQACAVTSDFRVAR